MTTDAVLYEVKRDAAWITLNQPERRNALGAELVDGLRAHLGTARGQRERHCDGRGFQFFELRRRWQ